MENFPAPPPLEAARAAAPSGEIVSQSEIESLLAQVGNPEFAAPAGADAAPGQPNVRKHEFPKVSLYSPGQLRPLRVRHEDFLVALAARLSLHLGMEVALQMSKIEAVTFQKFAEGLANPTHLTFLKLQPLKGICLLDLTPRLALCLVDRELGGPGKPAEEGGQVGKLETRLLLPIVNLIVQEWCAAWKDLLEIQPGLLGNESNSRYLRTSPPETSTLVVGIQVTMGETVEQMHLAFPHPMLEPLTLKLNAGVNEEKPGAAKAAQPKWNPLFDNVEIEVKAEFPEMEFPARQVANLKPGDVLTFPAEFMNQIRVRVADQAGFVGSLGTSQQRRAVKIEKRLQGV